MVFQSLEIFNDRNLKIKKDVIGQKIILTSGAISNFASKRSKRVKMRENYIFEGGLNKGHPIRTRICRSKSSLGHLLTLVINLEKKIFCFNHFALIAREITVFSQFLPVCGLFFSHFWLWLPVGWSNFHIEDAKESEILRYSSLNFWYKKYRKHFLQVASKPVLHLAAGG